MSQRVKNPPAMRGTWVRFLGWEDPLEEGMVLLLLPLGRDSHSCWLWGAEWFGLFPQGLGFCLFNLFIWQNLSWEDETCI